MNNKKTIKTEQPEKLFFCWERLMTGNWSPVVYHNEVPPLGSNGKEAVPIRYPEQPVLIPRKFIRKGEPMYGSLKKAYPKPEIKNER